MSSLNIEPVASTIDTLFKQADSTPSPQLDSLSEADRSLLLKSKTEYEYLYRNVLKDMWLPVSRETGQLLYLLARSTGAQNIIEFGTSFGISTIHLAAAVLDNGKGKIITTEFEPTKALQAREHFKQARVEHLIEIREGDALKTLAKDIPERVDMLLLDGAKALYNDVLTLIEPHLHAGSIIVADNADMNPEYLEAIRSRKQSYLSIAIGDDVELSLKIN